MVGSKKKKKRTFLWGSTVTDVVLKLWVKTRPPSPPLPVHPLVTVSALVIIMSG